MAKVQKNITSNILRICSLFYPLKIYTFVQIQKFDYGIYRGKNSSRTR
jgi:hypothetical protein